MKPYLRMIFMFAATAAAVGCTHVADKRPNHITGQTFDLRPKVENPVARVALAPVNIVPNVVSNFIAGLYPTTIWPAQYVLLPFSAIGWGIQDTFLGYPFWSPSALYEEIPSVRVGY